MTQRLPGIGADAAPNNAMRLLPVGMIDPADTPLGPCQLQSSPFCEHIAVMERLDPMAMAPENPAPASVIPTCRECFDHRSDQYLKAAAR